MIDKKEAIKRLLRLPSVINWARHNTRRLEETRTRLRLFAVKPPRISLGPVNRICASITYGDLTYQTAMAEVDKIAHPVVKQAGREVIPFFVSYAAANKIDGIKELGNISIPYPVGQGPDGRILFVPVRPTFTAVRDGALIPYFVIPWATLNLIDYQKQLISTVIEQALLTQQDYIGSDAVILGLPRIKHTKVRYERSWSVRKYATLTSDDLVEQFDRYGTALRYVVDELSVP